MVGSRSGIWNIRSGAWMTCRIEADLQLEAIPRRDLPHGILTEYFTFKALFDIDHAYSSTTHPRFHNFTSSNRH